MHCNSQNSGVLQQIAVEIGARVGIWMVEKIWDSLTETPGEIEVEPPQPETGSLQYQNVRPTESSSPTPDFIDDQVYELQETSSSSSSHNSIMDELVVAITILESYLDNLDSQEQMNVSTTESSLSQHSMDEITAAIMILESYLVNNLRSPDV